MVEDIPKDALKKTRLVEIADSAKVIERIKEIKKIHPGIVVAIRVELTAAGVERAIKLAEFEEVEVIHIVADANGNEIGAAKAAIYQGYDASDSHGPDRKRNAGMRLRLWPAAG